MSDSTTPLLPQRANAPPADSHPIFLRACHSPWRGIKQKTLSLIRAAITSYLIAVFGVSLKYKLETKDDHPKGRIPFQFSTVSFVLLLVYHLVVTAWTFMHLAAPRTLDADPEDCHGHRAMKFIINALSPPNNRTAGYRERFSFSLFYTLTHVFTFMNTIIYWAISVPTGHGGFKPPSMHHPHPPNSTIASFDPDKGLFEEGPIKSFSIINVWSITSIIALVEILFLNSIRRQTPVAGHVVGTVFFSAVYLAWAEVGKLVTGHSGLFFLDPEYMGDLKGAAFAASLAFLTFAPGIFSYMYGLIAMRESLTAHHDH